MTRCLRSIRSISHYSALLLSISRSQAYTKAVLMQWDMSKIEKKGKEEAGAMNLDIGQRVRPSSIPVISSPIFIIVV